MCCSEGTRTDPVNPPAASSFQNRFPGPGEMQAELRREVPGIDSAEEHAEIRTNQIGERLLHRSRTYAPASDVDSRGAWACPALVPRRSVYVGAESS